FTGLGPGSHTVTVRDANLCTNSQTITVSSCPGICTLTQGAYGNAGGVFTNPNSCYNNLGRLNLIKAMLGDRAFTRCGSTNLNAGRRKRQVVPTVLHTERQHPDLAYFAVGHRRTVKSYIRPRCNASREGFRSARPREPGVGWTVDGSCQPLGH